MKYYQICADLGTTSRTLYFQRVTKSGKYKLTTKESRAKTFTPSEEAVSFVTLLNELGASSKSPFVFKGKLELDSSFCFVETADADGPKSVDGYEAAFNARKPLPKKVLGEIHPGTMVTIMWIDAPDQQVMLLEKINPKEKGDIALALFSFEGSHFIARAIHSQIVAVGDMVSPPLSK